MANSLTNVNVTKVMTECIEALKDGLTPLRVFSLSVGSDPAEKNEYVNVPLVTARSVATNATNYEDGNTTITGKQVQLATNYSCAFHVTAVQASKTPTDLFAAAAKEAVYAVTNQIQIAALNLITAASFTNETIVTAANFDADALLTLRKNCVQTLKWRMGSEASVLIDPEYYANLMKDPAIRDLSASGVQAGVAGMAARFAGFNLYEMPQIGDSSNYAGTEDMRAVAALPRALALAVRPPAKIDSGSYEMNEVVSDPDGSGMAFNMRVWTNTATNTHWGVAEVLFGGVAVDGSGAWRIVAQ